MTMDWQETRQKWLTRPIFGWAKRALPTMSETEQEALEAGDVWWEADLFTGNPDWQQLLNTPKPELTAEEQAFMDGPVEELCNMLDEWKRTGYLWEQYDPQSGRGQRTHPFNGWSSLALLALAEIY